ncbi:MAG: uroporphyrinogen decarboxylase [Crocinitomicaceae bacterium]
MDGSVFGISFIEWVGYLASLGVLSSFLMRNIKTLRLINTGGCLLFVIYGFALNISWPIVITNVAIICINIYYLYIAPKPTE